MTFKLSTDEIYSKLLKQKEDTDSPLNSMNDLNDEDMVKDKIEKFYHMLSFNETQFLDTINDIFNRSQKISSSILRQSSRSFKQSDFEQLAIAIDASRRNIVNKLKSLFKGKLIEETHEIAIKDAFSDLVFEKHKYKKTFNQINELILLSFIIDLILDKYMAVENKDIDRNCLIGARVSLIKNASTVRALIDVNTSISNSLIQYVQTFSPELFNELMLNYFTLIDLNDKYSSKVKLRIEKINIIKNMAREKIGDFYSLDNIKKLNNIQKESEKNKNINIEDEINNIKTNIELLKISLVKLKKNLNLNIEELNKIKDESQERGVVDKIIDNCNSTLENMDEVISIAEKKINIIF